MSENKNIRPITEHDAAQVVGGRLDTPVYTVYIDIVYRNADGTIGTYVLQVLSTDDTAAAAGIWCTANDKTLVSWDYSGVSVNE